MKPSAIFTRRRFGLDNNVWLSMLLLIIICCGLLAYTAANKNKVKPCIPITIIVNGAPASKTKMFNTNDHLFFKAGVTIQSDDISWDFGDHSALEQGYTTSHVYKLKGIYSVTAIINGNCTNIAYVNIIQPVAKKDSIGNIVINIIGDDNVHTGTNNIYSTTLAATTYTWSVINNTYYQPRQGKQTAFKFKTPGIYTILLILDNNKDKSYTKDIIVTDSAAASKAANNDYEAPKKLIPDYPVVIPSNNPAANQAQQQTQPQTQPQTQTAQTTVAPEKHKINITDKQLKIMLQQVVSNSMHANDFERYFCSGANILVYVNNDKAPVKLSDLCNKIQGNKKINIESAHIVPDPDSKDCESNLVVKYKKSGFLGL